MLMRITALLIIVALNSCSLLHSSPQFELEKLSDDVLENKSGQGISIEITKIPAGK